MDYFSKDHNENYTYKDKDEETITLIEKANDNNEAKNKFARTFKIDAEFYNMIAILR